MGLNYVAISGKRERTSKAGARYRYLPTSHDQIYNFFATLYRN